MGTGYGKETSFATTNTEFERASETPNLILSLRYATKARLQSWGVPVEEVKAVSKPNPFPISQPSVPAPAGWNG